MWVTRFESCRHWLQKPFVAGGARLLWIGMLLTGASPLCAAVSVVDVPAGDTSALLAAITAGNLSPDTTIIRLSRSAEYRLNLSEQAPDLISGRIIIQGRGAHLVGDGPGSFGTLFRVLEGGALELSELVIRDFDSGHENLGASADGLILIQGGGVLMGRDLRFEAIHVRSNVSILGGIIRNNAGYLDLNRVRIVNVSISMPAGSFDGTIAIYNSGDANIQNMLIIDSFGEDAATAERAGTYVENILFGKLMLRFSSLILQSESTAQQTSIRAIAQHIVGVGVSPETSLAGTMIVDMECPGRGVESLGFNLFTDDSCDIGRANDLVGVSPGSLRFEQIEGRGIKVSLPPRSPAIDAVIDSAIGCPSVDAIGDFRPQDGNQDGTARCDIGAFETAGAASLFEGGANGLFYSADMDGHYVTIQENRPNEYVVLWNTFDLAGNQAWILALGTRDGDTIAGEAYFFPVGMLVPGSGADVDTDSLQRWGTLGVQLFNCRAGKLSYDSELPEFGTGSFELSRLAFVEGLGCQD